MFNSVTDGLLETNMEISDTNDSAVTSTPVNSGNKSPLGYLNSMINNLRQPRSKSSQDTKKKQCASVPSTPKRSKSFRNGRSSASVSSVNDNDQTFVKERLCSSNATKDSDQTLVKELFRDEASHELNSHDHQTTKFQDTATRKDSCQVNKSTEEHSNDVIRTKLNETETHLSEKNKENTVLQESLKELLIQSKLLKAENDKLLSLNECKDNDIKMLRSKVNESSEKAEQIEHELSRIKSDLADANAKILIYEDDFPKLQRQVDDISKEKSDLLDEMMRLRGSSDSVELKIEKSAECVENTVVGEINDF